VNVVFRHLRKQIVRGFLAAIPFILSYYVVRFIYLAAQTRLTVWIEKLIGFHVPGLGIILVIVLLYLLGLISANWLGRGALGLLDKVALHIPVVRTIFQLGKQLSSSLSLPEHKAFKRVVMVEPFQPGVWSVGFVTGEISEKARAGAVQLKVFVPTAPNPTAGFVVLVKESRVRNLPWTVPEALNWLVSVGVAGPAGLTAAPARAPAGRRKRS
jgi:uncharacterized membrane protein